MKLYKYLFVLFAFLVACNDSPVIKDGVQHTLESIKVEPGLSWFDLHYKEYAPNDSLCNLIKEQYDDSQFELVMFTTYLCDCNENSTYLPTIAKIFTHCDIPDSNITIFLMTSREDETPYKGDIVINEFPEAYLLKNGKPFASLIATKEELPDTEQSFENAILTAINK